MKPVKKGMKPSPMPAKAPKPGKPMAPVGMPVGAKGGMPFKNGGRAKKGC